MGPFSHFQKNHRLSLLRLTTWPHTCGAWVHQLTTNEITQAVNPCYLSRRQPHLGGGAHANAASRHWFALVVRGVRPPGTKRPEWSLGTKRIHLYRYAEARDRRAQWRLETLATETCERADRTSEARARALNDARALMRADQHAAFDRLAQALHASDAGKRVHAYERFAALTREAAAAARPALFRACAYTVWVERCGCRWEAPMGFAPNASISSWRPRWRGR